MCQCHSFETHQSHGDTPVSDFKKLRRAGMFENKFLIANKSLRAIQQHLRDKFTSLLLIWVPNSWALFSFHLYMGYSRN
jgi:hypothetical protein